MNAQDTHPIPYPPEEPAVGEKATAEELLTVAAHDLRNYLAHFRAEWI
jgi:hypothetical protein